MSDPFEKLAILIPTRNRPEILATTLAELKQAGLGQVALWVYDDCSKDPGAIDKVVRSWPGGRVLRGTARAGQAEGRNVLMRSCGKEFGLLIDDDSFPKDTAVLQKYLASAWNPNCAIVTFQYLDVPTQRLSMAKELGAGESRSFHGGGSLFHIPTVLRLGGFRKSFIYGYEEPELAMRIRLNGCHIWYDPSLTVHHNHFETPNECRDYCEYDYLYARNGILMSSFNMPLLLGLPHGLLRSARRSLLQNRHFGAKLKGTLAGIGMSLFSQGERTPCSWRAAKAWLRFNRECNR